MNYMHTKYCPNSGPKRVALVILTSKKHSKKNRSKNLSNNMYVRLSTRDYIHLCKSTPKCCDYLNIPMS
ncbi:hypothetical protein H8356DRAFT_1352759 [Neocallimastix lanati (nom. inval.)]|nr:hypothetical protein H8356DRAFT_1352759 [Neocallimastix sp. JGI-2020a]